MTDKTTTLRAPYQGTAALIIGRFDPPTVGHAHLIDFALSAMQGNKIFVVVCHRAGETVPIGIRTSTFKARYGDLIDIRELSYDGMQAEPNGPDDWAYWLAWVTAIRQRICHPIDFVFASDTYGGRLAQHFEARFVPVDLDRQVNRISATICRSAMFENWHNLMPEYRRNICRTVAIVGPESVGKTTLCQQLAQHFQTKWVPEWARQYLENEGNRFPVPEDYYLIGAAQLSAKYAGLVSANRVLICDTDIASTDIAQQVLNKHRDQYVKNWAYHEQFDLRLLLAEDVPFQPDPIRYGGSLRQLCSSDFEQYYREIGRDWVRIEGSWLQRFNAAVTEIEKIIPKMSSHLKKED